MPADLITVLDHVDAHISESLTLGELSRITYTTPSTLERRFSKHLGMPVSVFIRRRKMSVAARLLEQGYSVLAAGEAVGYTDNSHFIKRFGEYCGLTPLQYKKAYGDKK